MKIVSNVKNMGKKVTGRKLVIFECDDWGSNRIVSLKEFETLVAKGVISAKSHYNKDTLERKDDIELLFEVLTGVKDKNGHGAVMTPFVNPVNPDFDKIKANGFTEYFYQDFTKTHEEFGEKKEIMNLWSEGINSGIFVPAYHAREHLCVPLWMEYLRKKDPKVMEGFLSRFFAVKASGLPAEAAEFRPGLYFDTNEQKDFIKQSLVDGVQVMQQLFGMKPQVFCPPNGVSHPEFDEALSKEGIKAIVTGRERVEPDGKGGVTKQKYSYGAKNKWGQAYYYRNCCFEPVAAGNAIDVCLTQVEAAFRWGKPAVISTHRVNFAGGINPAMRDKGLTNLKTLLQTIQKKWPDAEFVSSNEVALLLHKDK